MVGAIHAWTSREAKACGYHYEDGASLAEIADRLNRQFHRGAAVRNRNMIAGQLDRLRVAGVIVARSKKKPVLPSAKREPPFFGPGRVWIGAIA